jgi:hypothetical protein
MNTPVDWLLRVNDGVNLERSIPYKRWGIFEQSSSNTKKFVENVKNGDRLWFITNKSNGKIVGVATFESQNKRNENTPSDEELGWVQNPKTPWLADTEIHYTNFYECKYYDYLTHIKGNCGIRKYNEKCRIELPVIYNTICMLLD